MDFVTTKWTYCIKCGDPKGVAELKVSGWLHAIFMCSDCMEKLAKKVAVETGKMAERAAVNNVIEKTEAREALPGSDISGIVSESRVISRSEPLPESTKLIKGKDRD